MFGSSLSRSLAVVLYISAAKTFGDMLKITILTLFLIGSAVWAQGISCDSCGSECASACGTRHFRSCCFNYLRRKRPDNLKMWYYTDGRRSQELPVFTENIPDDRFGWVANERFGMLDGIDERD